MTTTDLPEGAARHPSLQLLDALAARGTPRIKRWDRVEDVPWEKLAAFPHSRGEEMVIALAGLWAHGAPGNPDHVIASVDPGLAAVVAKAAADYERSVEAIAGGAAA